MSKCEECLNSRFVISENGHHAVCCLSEDKAFDCMIGKENHFDTFSHYDYGFNELDDDECFDVCSDMCLMTKFFEYSNKSSKGDWDAEYFNVITKTNGC